MSQSVSKVFGEVIFAYTRQNAIEDGVLVDVSAIARTAGFKLPCVFTAALFADVEEFASDNPELDVKRAIRKTCRSAVETIRHSGASGADVYFTPSGARGEVRCNVGHGDNGEAVITIGYPEDF